MMKIGYKLESSSAIIELNELKFKEALIVTSKEGYEMLQRCGKNEIISYLSCTIEGTSIERIADVGRLYGIFPNEKRSRGGEDQYVFYFSQELSAKVAKRTAENLGVLYQGVGVFYSYYSGTCAKEEISSTPLIVRSVNSLFVDRNIVDTVNETKAIVLNDNIDIIPDVLKALGSSAEYDSILGIFPGHGKLFDYVYDVLGSVESAYAFLNENAGTDFEFSGDANGDMIMRGVSAGAKGIVEMGGKYFATTLKGEEKVITDFVIRVHYKVVKKDSIAYVVSLLNTSGVEVKQIEWKNTSSEQGITDFLLKHGPFHFYGNKDHAKRVHEMISYQNVPTIYVYTTYGLNEYKGNKIMLLSDGIYDMSLNKYFPKDEELGIYFLGGNDGIRVDDAYEITSELPSFGNRIEEHDINYYLDITNKLYSGDSKYIIWMIACSMLGYAIYEPCEDSPLFFLTGPTGSGKSTFAQILGSAFGVKKQYSIGHSTPAPLKKILSSVRLLPIFMTEYRSSMNYKDVKDESLRLVFSKEQFSRGRQDGSIASAKLSAQVFLEGEDMYDSGSIRTRTIVHKTTRNERMDVNAKSILKERQSDITTFLLSYVKQTNKKDYMKHFNDAFDMLYKKDIEPRIIDNFCLMYAGCMAYAPEMKEKFLEIILKMRDLQQVDFKQNGQANQAVKLVGMYVSERYSNVYFDGNNVIFSWDDVIKYIERNRKKVELNYEANHGLLVEMGFIPGKYIVRVTKDFEPEHEIMVDGFRVHIKDCPQELFTHKSIYALSVAYNRSIQLGKTI